MLAQYLINSHCLSFKFLLFRVPNRKPSVQQQKDARKSGNAEKLATTEETLQKKCEEEEKRTKKAASTQSRQLSDLVNYAGEYVCHDAIRQLITHKMRKLGTKYT